MSDCTSHPVLVAVRGKGLGPMLRRGWHIVRRYGLTPSRMERALKHLAMTLDRFQSPATLFIPAEVLERHPSVARRLQARGIEIAVHGYRHVDYTSLPPAVQQAHLATACHTFSQVGIQVKGFRAPYLRWNHHTLDALHAHGLAYDSSQGLFWPGLPFASSPTYRRALEFYHAQSADSYPALPYLEGGLVRIPYTLPDDEALVERISLSGPEAMSAIWLDILNRTYQLGEVFTLGLHPERVSFCREALIAVLDRARSLGPKVWIARLDEIAEWWRARAQARIHLHPAGIGRWRIRVDAPEGAVLHLREVQAEAPTTPWDDRYRQSRDTAITIRSPSPPCIGLSPDSDPALQAFLRQQGYPFEVSDARHRYPLYLDIPVFRPEERRSLLDTIEKGTWPLVRLGRWPQGARSVLAITGDIDALTLWDYILRLRA